jgi:multiple sugar transport system permease protein
MADHENMAKLREMPLTERKVSSSLQVRERTFWSVLSDDRNYKWLLLIPLVLALLIFMLYPLFYCIWYSLHQFGMVKAATFIGLENYRDVLRDEEFWRALGRTGIVLVISIGAELVIGMAIAVLFNREFKGQNAIRGLILLPLLIAPLAVSMMWNFFLQYDFGIVNLMLGLVGIPKTSWFAPGVGLYTIAAISVWQWTPFAIFVFLAGLKSLPRDSFEAAKVDGAGSWYTFRRLTLPNLTPLIMIVILLRTMWLIRLFDPLYGTTRGGADTELLDWLIYRDTFVYFDIGRGSTLAIISLFMTLIVCGILFRQLMKALSVKNN